MPWTLRAKFDHLCFALTDVSELSIQIRRSDQDRQVEFEGKAEGLGANLQKPSLGKQLSLRCDIAAGI
jgi:hypothetical protein